MALRVTRRASCAPVFRWPPSCPSFGGQRSYRPSSVPHALVPTAGGEIPFTEFTGQPTFRGFDNRRDYVSAVASLDYRWYVGRFLDARLFTDIARGGSLVSELRFEHLRWAAGFGIESAHLDQRSSDASRWPEAPRAFTCCSHSECRQVSAIWAAPGVIMRRILALSLFAALSCTGYRPTRFGERPPVVEARDDQPIAPPHWHWVPEPVYISEVYLHRPLREALDLSPYPDAGDVNSFDDVVRSTWFAPKRLDLGTMARGPIRVGRRVHLFHGALRQPDGVLVDRLLHHRRARAKIRRSWSKSPGPARNAHRGRFRWPRVSCGRSGTTRRRSSSRKYRPTIFGDRKGVGDRLPAILKSV